MIYIYIYDSLFRPWFLWYGMIGWSGAVAHWAWHSTELGRNQAELGSPMELKTDRKTSEGLLLFVRCPYHRFLAGSFKYFFFSSRKLGKIPILTHIFQRGWFNHQLASGDFLRKKSPNNTTELEPWYPQNHTPVLWQSCWQGEGLDWLIWSGGQGFWSILTLPCRGVPGSMFLVDCVGAVFWVKSFFFLRFDVTCRLSFRNPKARATFWMYKETDVK